MDTKSHNELVELCQAQVATIEHQEKALTEMQGRMGAVIMEKAKAEQRVAELGDLLVRSEAAAAAREQYVAGMVPAQAGMPAADPVVEANVELLRSRSALGIAKYGTTLADSKAPLRDWLEHALLESLDCANYLQTAMHKIDAAAPQQHAQAALSDAELADPEFVRAYIASQNESFAVMMNELVALRKASQQPAAAPSAAAERDLCQQCLGFGEIRGGACPCGDGLEQAAAPAIQQEGAAQQVENSKFHKWWEESGQGTEPQHTLLVQNCAHAAWQARAALAAPAQPAPVADAVPVEAKPFAYFVQPSSFGPFIECESSRVGAFAAYRTALAAKPSEGAA